MLDLGRIADVVTSITGTAGSPADAVLQKLSELGIDAARLESLDAGQIAELAARYGIDIAGLDLTELAGRLEQIGGNQEIVPGIGQWLSDRLGR